MEANNLETHCLVCNVTLKSNVADTFDIFKTLIAAEGSFPELTIVEKIQQLLDRPSTNIIVHSDTVCQRCFGMLAELHSTEVKLNALRSDLVSKYNQTVVLYEHEQGGKRGQGVKGATDEGHRLVITEEGKVVDRNGIEKFPISKKTRRKGLAGGKKYACSVCGKSFNAFSHRVEHMLIHLGEKPWACPECKRLFRTKSALKVHRMKHTGERPFACRLCGKSFVDKYYLDEHSRIHSGEKPFLCSFCSRSFVRKKDLSVHVRSHTGDKPFRCGSCPKAFAVKSRLERHARTHTGEKPHACEVCGKLFARRDDYKVHARQHTGEKPFQCGHCSKAFTSHSNCLSHARTHTGESVRHACWACDSMFDRRAKLERHVKECHEGAPPPESLYAVPVAHGDPTTYVSLAPDTHVNVVT
ncbi:zinc finger protein OZF-like isoform X1 [Bacillus rossius redtenbacheri]|uniref:zinc finger protein OZF-like isoform X1 n=2 Tax=Bacillus rossius redtenbacheri TaxID=93214 RepID=UPI002FDD18F8